MCHLILQITVVKNKIISCGKYKKKDKIMLLHQNNEKFNYIRIQSVKNNAIFYMWIGKLFNIRVFFFSKMEKPEINLQSQISNFYPRTFIDELPSPLSREN